MPEIWLNYGSTNVVLDIRAENLDEQVGTEGNVLSDLEIGAKLDSLDISKPIELVVLNNSISIKKIIKSIYENCSQKSVQKPRILADKKIVKLLKQGLPEDSSITEFNKEELSNSSLIFIGEMEFDGLFGFETVATRLTKKFGNEQMLSAYEKRKENLPVPGQETENIKIAQNFTDSFDIVSIEIAANSKGIVDLSVGHPKSTMSISKSFLSSAEKNVEKHRTMMISTGKDASNDTLGRTLASLWNCNKAIKENGLAILLAECTTGIGSEAIQQYIEGRMSLDRLKKPSKYVNGMEDLLFLIEIQKRFQVGMVSILPEFYFKKLNIISFGGIKQAMDHVLKSQGINQKVAVVSDGARVLLN